MSHGYKGKWESDTYPVWAAGYYLTWRTGLGVQISPYKEDRGVAVMLGPLLVWVWLGAYTEMQGVEE